MIDVIGYIQRTLDGAFCMAADPAGSVYNGITFNTSAFLLPRESETPLHSYWLLRQDLTADQTPDEYIVYTAEEKTPDIGADGAGLIYRSYITIRYFCRDSWIGDAEKYAEIKTRMEKIRKALLDAGFDVTTGWKDAGDVDGISFETFVLAAEYTEIDYGDD